MDRTTFERALHHGLGRVILFLQTHDAAPYRDLILHACLHNTAYDPQLDGLKTDYLIEIIELTGKRDFYRREILAAAAAVNEATDDWDANLRFGLVEAFALRGDQEARQLLYDYVATEAENEDSLGIQAIIAVDGFHGLLFILDLLNQKNQFPTQPELLWDYESSVGNDEMARTHLAEARQTHPNLDRYLRILEQQLRELPKRDESRLTYADIKQVVEHGLDAGGFSKLLRWRQTATDEEFLEAAHDLLASRDQPERLRVYLVLFLKHAFPLDPASLFSLLDLYREDRFLQARLMTALQQITHPAVRTFALALIDQEQWSQRAVGLLAHNFELEDWTVIEKLSLEPLDQERYHTLGMSIREVFDQQPTTDPRAVQAMLNLYEAGPCSHCREQIIRQLQAFDVLPDAIKDECRFDSNLHIRAWAEDGFKPHPSRNVSTSDS